MAPLERRRVPLLAALIVAATGCADDPPLLLGVESARQVGTRLDGHATWRVQLVPRRARGVRELDRDGA